MNESFVEDTFQEVSISSPEVEEKSESHVEKIGEIVNLGAMDQLAMEVVDTASNEHYMLLVGADATLQTIEPQLRQLANLSEDTLIYLVFQSQVLGIDEYLHSYISDVNNTFYMLHKETHMAHTPVEETTSRFLAYETRISELTSEITHLKVDIVEKDNRIEELEKSLHEHNIPLPEEKLITEQKKEEMLQKQVEEEEKAVMTKAVHLKWTDQGVEGIKALINEINKFTYTNLEVLDISDLHMGDEGCMLLAKVFSQGWSLVNVFQVYFSPPTLPCLHSLILYGNDITKKGASALISAFKYLPQVELLGLEVLRRRLSNKEVEIFNHMQLDSLLFTSTSLDISNLNLVDNFLVQFCAYVDYLITGDSPTIRKLYMNNNRFKSRGVMKLASLIADGKLSNIETFNMEDNEIEEEAAHLVACCITQTTTPNLKEFYLGGNPIGDKGVISLFRYFRKNEINSIIRLSLRKVQMGYEGIRNISNAVLFNTMQNLEFLNLSSNNIQSKGFIYIIKSIERGGLPVLQELLVNDNHITDDGVKYLITALTRSPLGVVSKIEIADNSISKGMIETCEQALSGQNQLHVIYSLKRS